MLPSLRTALFWSSLNILTRERMDALVNVYGSLETAATQIDRRLLEALGCRQETIREILEERMKLDLDALAQELEQRQIQLLQWGDRDYPARLADIGDAPPFLYAKGDLSVLQQPTVSLVGTRKMSIYGKRVTKECVPAFVRAGMVTVSGLASGIDALVARETIDAGGKTVAVLGHGLGMIYPPTNKKLAENIVESGGLLLSEFPLHLPPAPYTFPARNRIVAALGLATIVLEAPRESGALITAKLAHGYGRDVFAVPGQIFDPGVEGSHELLLKKIALPMRVPDDVLRELGIVAPKDVKSSYAARSPQEEVMLKVLTTMPQPVDDLVERTGLGAGAVASVLTMMELGGGAKNVGGGLWVRA
jgi:DNA processing protein